MMWGLPYTWSTPESVVPLLVDWCPSTVLEYILWPHLLDVSAKIINTYCLSEGLDGVGMPSGPLPSQSQLIPQYFCRRFPRKGVCLGKTKKFIILPGSFSYLQHHESILDYILCDLVGTLCHHIIISYPDSWNLLQSDALCAIWRIRLFCSKVQKTLKSLSLLWRKKGV